MPVSESQKKSNREWDKRNMRTISCRVRTFTAEMFKEYCESIGSNPANEVKKFINECADKYEKQLEEQYNK